MFNKYAVRLCKAIRFVPSVNPRHDVAILTEISQFLLRQAMLRRKTRKPHISHILCNVNKHRLPHSSQSHAALFLTSSLLVPLYMPLYTVNSSFSSWPTDTSLLLTTPPQFSLLSNSTSNNTAYFSNVFNLLKT